MADDTSNLINLDRLTTYDGLIKDYIGDRTEVAQDVLDEITALNSSVASGKSTIATAINNKGGSVTSSNTFAELGSAIDSIKTGSGTAAAADVLDGKTFTNDSGTYTGTMDNNGAISGTVNCGGSYTIPAGYTSGGKVTGNSLSSQTSATATAADILSSKTAYVNGTKLTGSITSKAAATYTPKSTKQTISKGVYLSGDQTISGDTNLAAGNIKSGVSIFGVSGSFRDQKDKNLNNITEYKIIDNFVL